MAIRSITGREYSFIHFMLIGVIPTAYWITVIELACVYSSDDAEVPASYGQASHIPHSVRCMYTD